MKKALLEWLMYELTVSWDLKMSRCQRREEGAKQRKQLAQKPRRKPQEARCPEQVGEQGWLAWVEEKTLSWSGPGRESR